MSVEVYQQWETDRGKVDRSRRGDSPLLQALVMHMHPRTILPHVEAPSLPPELCRTYPWAMR
jgi:hypothetical protein